MARTVLPDPQLPARVDVYTADLPYIVFLI